MIWAGCCLRGNNPSRRGASYMRPSTGSPLRADTGAAPTQAREKITRYRTACGCSRAGASNPHRVRSRMIGNRYIITLDIEVNPHITVTQAHDIAEAVEKSIENSIDNIYDILVHVEPAGECQADEKFGVDKGMV